MKGAQAHSARRIACEALHRHVRHDIAAILDVGSLTEGRVRTADIVMIASDHDRADLAVPDHLIELQRDPGSALRILIEDPRLSPDDKLIGLCIADPDVVIPVLSAASRIDAAHCGGIGLIKILGLA